LSGCRPTARELKHRTKRILLADLAAIARTGDSKTKKNGHRSIKLLAPTLWRPSSDVKARVAVPDTGDLILCTRLKRGPHRLDLDRRQRVRRLEAYGRRKGCVEAPVGSDLRRERRA
jgi:hypothetical protein